MPIVGICSRVGHGFSNSVRNRLEVLLQMLQHLGAQTASRNQFLRCLVVACLLSHSSQAMHMLRRQSYVAHDRHPCRRDPSNRICDGASTFQLYSRRPAFLEEFGSIPHRLVRRDLISQKRHIGDNQSPLSTSCYSLRMVNDGIQCYRNGRVQSQDHMTKGVAD